MWVIILLLVILLIIGCIPRKRITKVKLYDENTGTVYHMGEGFSVGEAMVDLFSKVSSYLSESSKLDTVEVRLRGMKRALEDNRYSMKKRDIQECKEYLQVVQDLFNQKTAEQERMLATLPVKRRFMMQQRKLLTDGMRYDVLKRDGFRCQLCGATAKDGIKLHVDHIIPISKGGKTEMQNLRTLCERCNLGKGNKIE